MSSSLAIEKPQQYHFFELSLVKKDFIEFTIKTFSDLVMMLQDYNLRMNFELHHIASELAENMLEERNEGTVIIAPNKVVNVVKYKDIQDCSDKYEKFINGLHLAKSSKEKQWNGSSIGKIGFCNRGRGLSSILRMGWKINHHLQDNQLTIEVVKL